MSMTRLLRKINKKTIWLYLGAAALLITAVPTKPSFIVGLVVVCMGETIRVWAAGYLRKNEILVTSGPYAYVKNPLYIGTMLITAGFCIMANNIYLLTLAFLGFIFYYIPYKKRVESNRLMGLFGESYAAYDSQVDDYMPRLRPYEKAEGNWRFEHVIGNSEEGIVALLAVGALLIALRFWV
jgi:protein-S-isoprenylcysteine O-methyltransferase Ste14